MNCCVTLSRTGIGGQNCLVASSGQNRILEERVHRRVADAGLGILGSRDREGWRHLSGVFPGHSV